MRKLLLASAATLAIGGAGAAPAQEAPLPATVLQGQVATRPTASVPGANNNNNYQAPALAGAIVNPTPGSIVIHLNARVMMEAGAGFSSIDHVTTEAGDFKREPASILSYMRIYPGMDGLAANGLRYGGSIELRENFTAFNTSTTSSGASGYTSGETVFVRRAFVYLANDRLGILRVGQADGLIGIFDNGVTTFQNITPTSVFNGGDEQSMVPGVIAPPFVFLSQAGNEYGNNKFVYLSPQIAGFDIGLQWAPTIGNGFGACDITGSGCAGLSSSSIPPDGARVLNQYAAGVRYESSLGDVGLLAYAVYEGSGHTQYTGTATAAVAQLGAGAAPGTTYNGKFNNIGVTSIGAAVTFAGLIVGGNGIFGQMNGVLAPKPEGGAGVSAWLVGARYVFGPASIGAAFESMDQQGAIGLTGISQRHSYAAAVGASYSIAPGLTGFAEYQYMNQKQSGFNFVTSTAGAANNTVQGQAFLVGTLVTW
jgi:predicted porin